MTLNFKDCTLEQLDETFDLEQIDDCQILQVWLSEELEISDLERQVIVMFQKTLKSHVHDWNETELIQHFIGPIFSLVNFSSKKFSLFAERSFSGTINGIEMSGKPDGIIASGFRKPKNPYFCFQEYKKEKDPEGDPAAQALAAMLVAQEINEHKHPIYGCYVRSQFWFFIVLQEAKYCISHPYTASRDDIFDIFRILKVLKRIVADMVERTSNIQSRTLI
jgi:hypothetical protein